MAVSHAITVTDTNGNIHHWDGKAWSHTGTDPTKCTAAVTIKGVHFWCDMHPDHGSWGHSNEEAEVVWDGPDHARFAARQTDATLKATKAALK